MAKSFFTIEPEVVAEIGEETVFDREARPLPITKLHYHFNLRPRDAISEAAPCFVVTDKAKRAFLDGCLTGAQFAPLTVSKSRQFDEMVELHDPSFQLPDMAWMKIYGVAGQDDFGLRGVFELVVSERALEILKRLGINRAVVEPFSVHQPK